MTFLNPLLLVGLAAAAIPIIIHLLNLRKLKTIEFSSLQFLKELQKTKMRRVKIKQWLLLALRTLLIIALVLAFARPALEGSLAGTIGTHAKTTSVILLDDSPSMHVRNERGVLFSQARDAATRIAGMMREGDESFLVRISDVGRTETFTAGQSPDVLNTALADIQPALATASYRDAFRVAARLLAESNNFNQEVHLLTDAQATQFAIPSDDSDTLQLFPERARVFMTEIESPAIQNTAVTGVTVTSRIISPGKPVGLQIEIWNFGTTAIVNGLMSVYLDGARVVQQTVNVPAGGSVTATASVIPKRRGALAGEVQIEDDALEADNRRSFVIQVPSDIAVLFVGPTLNEVRLPALALTLDSDTAGLRAFRTQSIPESRLSSTDIARFDVVVLCGVRDFSPTEAERLAGFVKSGGGMILFPGDATDVGNYNSTLLARMGVPGLAMEPAAADQSGFVSFDRVDLAHPLFAGLFEQPSGTNQPAPALESPRVYRSVSPRTGQNGQFIITLSSGTGFLTEYPVETGRLLLFSVEAGLAWSDFPLKGLFVPLLHRSVLYLAAQNQLPQDFLVGDRMQLTTRVPAGQQGGPYILRSPGGIEEKVIPGMVSASGVVSFTAPFATETGVYELRTQSGNAPEGMLQAIPVNINPVESDPGRVDDDEFDRFRAGIGVREEQIRRVVATDQIDVVVRQSRFGVELWKHFLLLALLCALTEMIIGRGSKGEQGA